MYNLDNSLNKGSMSTRLFPNSYSAQDYRDLGHDALTSLDLGPSSVIDKMRITVCWKTLFGRWKNLILVPIPSPSGCSAGQAS